MSSRKKGDDFENLVFNWFCANVENELRIRRNDCKVFQKKSYFSQKRNANIIIDISIELFRPGSDEPFLIFLIECKNYSAPVPVSDVEEFYSKLDQIAGKNVKGIFASTSSFQKSALELASSYKMGLIRFSGQEPKWILNRSVTHLISKTRASSNHENALRGILIESFHDHIFECTFFAGGIYTNSLNIFMENLLNLTSNDEDLAHLTEHFANYQPPRSTVSFLSQQDIQAKADHARQMSGHTNGPVMLHTVCNWQAKESNLSVIYNASNCSNFDENNTILGKITFDPLIITICSDTQSNKGRFRFTLAHELGHLLLGHAKYMKSEIFQESDTNHSDTMNLGIDDVSRMEWQANSFAGSLLMPEISVRNDVDELIKAYGLRDRGFGLLYLDDQRCNKQDVYKIVNSVAEKYLVSQQAVKLRLKQLKILIEEEVGRFQAPKHLGAR